MPTKTSLHCLVLLLLFAAAPALAINIQLHEQVQVSTPFIRLGDIASIAPKGREAKKWAEQRISRSPEPGKSKILQSASLIASLRHIKNAENIHWNGAEHVTVSRRGIEISKEKIKRIIAEFIGKNLKKLPDADVRFTLVRAPEIIILPAGKLSYTVMPSRHGILSSSSFSIIFKVDGKTVKNCTVRGKLEAMAEVAAAAVNVRKGSIITADQIELIRQDISKLDTPYPSIDQVVGLLAKRTIRAGRAFDSHNVEPPPVIKKGEPVKIIADRGALQITTNGVAIMDGRPGDFIRVKNIRSNRLVYCRVDAPGIVSVEF
ncbi:MAG TPA: flagellar basal body P-ring formation protein FlgA [Desulfobulbaceae bacterium]|nr:flagellar basal body P-ring formation protein FlgA [Desulfobulbaceae bacterium]